MKTPAPIFAALTLALITGCVSDYSNVKREESVNLELTAQLAFTDTIPGTEEHLVWLLDLREAFPGHADRLEAQACEKHGWLHHDVFDTTDMYTNNLMSSFDDDPGIRLYGPRDSSFAYYTIRVFCESWTVK